MSTLTDKYELIKPDLTDPADITAMNSNWDKIDEALSNGGHILNVTSTDGVTYVANDDTLTLTNGLTITIIPNITSTSKSVNLTVNGTTAKIYQSLSTNSTTNLSPTSVSWLSAGKPVMITYNDTVWKTVATRTAGSDVYGTVQQAVADGNGNNIVDTYVTNEELDELSASMQLSIGDLSDTKVDKVSGKGLSTNDLTNNLKSNYDTAYNNNHTHSNKSVLDSTTASYTTTEKNKLSGIETGANKTSVDSSLSSSSTNPLQNKVINTELNKRAMQSEVDELSASLSNYAPKLTLNLPSGLDNELAEAQYVYSVALETYSKTTVVADIQGTRHWSGLINTYSSNYGSVIRFDYGGGIAGRTTQYILSNGYWSISQGELSSWTNVPNGTYAITYKPTNTSISRSYTIVISLDDAVSEAYASVETDIIAAYNQGDGIWDIDIIDRPSAYHIIKVVRLS